jgi:hypothetical protein
VSPCGLIFLLLVIFTIVYNTNVDASMSLLDHPCADDSLVRRFVRVIFLQSYCETYHFPFDDCILCSVPVIQFGSIHFTGDMIAQSFADGSFPDSKFMTAFVNCLSYDDY